MPQKGNEGRKEFYDRKYYRRYNLYLKKNLEDIPAFRIVSDLLDVKSDQKLLDAGCGIGYLADWLRSSSRCVTVGLDVTRICLISGKELYPSTNFLRGDSLSLPFRDGCFDRIVCYNVLEHLARPEKALEEICRCLRVDGIVVLGTVDKLALYKKLFIHDPTHIHEFSTMELVNAVSELFKIEKVVKTNLVGRFSRFLNDLIARVLPCDVVVKARKEEL